MATRLIEADPIQVDIRAYRRKARMGRREMERIENLTTVHLEARVRLEDVLGLTPAPARSVPRIPVERVVDAEEAAAKVRSAWGLGEDPIASVIDTFEEHHIPGGRRCGRNVRHSSSAPTPWGGYPSSSWRQSQPGLVPVEPDPSNGLKKSAVDALQLRGLM